MATSRRGAYDAIPFSTDQGVTRAFDFADSIGVNLHLGWIDTVYCNGPVVLGMLQVLGIRHVRDMPPTGWKVESDNGLALLASNGMKFNFVYGATGTSSDLNVSVPTDISQVVKFMQQFPGSVISMEGPNELNGQEVILNGASSLDPHVGADIQRHCASQTRGNSTMQSAGVKMMNLSITNGRDGWSQYVDALGDLSAHCDQANWHVYFWQGLQPSHNVDYMMDDAHRSAPNKPIVFTEAGWPTAYENELGLDPVTAAKHTLNLVAYTWMKGIVRTYIYQLQDPHPNPAPNDPESQFGLCNSNGTLKPAGTAIRNLLSIVRDASKEAAVYRPQALDYRVDGLPSTAYTMVLQKASGVYDILVWNEADDWDANANKPKPVSPVNVVIHLPKDYVVHVFDPVNGTTSQALGSVSVVELALSDRMLIVELI